MSSVSEAKLRPRRLECHDTLKEFTEDYWHKASEARPSGQPVAWVSGITPIEFLQSQGFFIIAVMNISATCGSRKASTQLCEIADAEGYSRDLCSYPRTNIGLVLAGEGPEIPLRVPKPDLLLVANGQCHTITKWLESLARILGVPVFLVDVPFIHDGTGEETYFQAHRYVVEQLQELIVFLENFAGRRFNYDRLQESLQASREMFKMFREVLKMRQNIPSPISVFDVFTNLTPILIHRGTSEGVNYYRQLKAEVAERVAQGVGAVPGERFRLHLDGVPMWFNLSWLYSKFASYGACPITHVYPMILTFDGLDPSSPLVSYADSVLQSYMNCGVRQRAERITKLVEEYHLDGLAMQMSLTCKAVCTGVYDICREVEKRTGVPWFTYETDMCDAQLHSNADVEAKIAAFMESLEGRSGANRG